MSVTIFFMLISSLYLIINVILVLVRNYKAQQFFNRKSPKLPILPKPNIFTGHISNTIFKDKNWLAIDKLHARHGPTFGYYLVDQPWISTKDLDLLKLIELDQPARHVNRAKFGSPFNEFNKSIFQVDDEEWRRQRRAIAPAFTNLKVRNEDVTDGIEAILKLVKDGIDFRMKTENDGEQATVLDVDDMFHRYTLAVLFTVVYGSDCEIDFKAERDSWTSRLDESSRSLHNPFFSMSVMLPFIQPLLAFLVRFHNTGKMSAQIMKYIVEATDVNRIVCNIAQNSNGESVKKKDGNNKRRLIDPIVDALMDKRIKRDEFVNGLHFLVLAGFKTTADTITCLVWHLARHPHIQEHLRNSILKEGLDSEYLGWCVLETVRIHPAVPLGTGRVLGDDVTVNGLFLPKGTFVMPSTYSIHHDPNIWSTPDEFKPERWRDTSGHHPAAFMGFGLGPRNCLGSKIAVHEIKLAMRLLLTNYNIEQCPETVDKYEFSSPMMIFTTVDRPIKVKLVALSKDPSK